MEGEPRPHRHWLLPLRMLLAGLLITVCTGGAVATAGLLELKNFTDEFRDLSHEAPLRKGTVERRRPASRRRSSSSAPTTASATARTTPGRTR